MLNARSNLAEALKKIELGVDEIEKKSQPDEFDLKEEQSAEDSRQDLAITEVRREQELGFQKIEEEVARLKSDRTLRETYGNRILRFLEWYGGVVGAIIIIDGFAAIPFDIDPNATVALVGSTAIAAIGLVGFVAKGLFDKTNL